MAKTFGGAFGFSPKYQGFSFDRESFFGDTEIHGDKKYSRVSISLGWLWFAIDNNQWLLTEAGLGD